MFSRLAAFSTWKELPGNPHGDCDEDQFDEKTQATANEEWRAAWADVCAALLQTEYPRRVLPKVPCSADTQQREGENRRKNYGHGEASNHDRNIREANPRTRRRCRIVEDVRIVWHMLLQAG